jgi:hypothetical protein
MLSTRGGVAGEPVPEGGANGNPRGYGKIINISSLVAYQGESRSCLPERETWLIDRRSQRRRLRCGEARCPGDGQVLLERLGEQGGLRECYCSRVHCDRREYLCTVPVPTPKL